MDGFITLIKNNTGLAVSSLSDWSTAVLSAQIRYGKVVLVLYHRFGVKMQRSGHILYFPASQQICLFLSKNPCHSWWPVAYRSNCPWFFKDVFVPIPLFLPSLFPIFSSFSLTSEPLMYCCRAMPLCTLLLNMPSIKTRYLTFDLVLPWMKDFTADAWQWLFSGQVTTCSLVGMSLSKAVYRVVFTILSRFS